MASVKSTKLAALLVGSGDVQEEAPPAKAANLHAVPGLGALVGTDQRLADPSATKPQRVAGWGEIREAATKLGGLNPAARGVAQAVEASAAQQTAEIERLQKMVAEGMHVQEIDPGLIDPSFIRDRMEIDEEGVQALAKQIAAEGQLIPILVRPHPTEAGRFQTAYGHRRRLACSILERPVRAIVRDLTDDELIIAQGQENNARLNLSFIEKAMFAKALSDRQTLQRVIASAIGVGTHSVISSYLKIVSLVTPDLIQKIGPAPSVGRRRWEELAEFLKGGERRIETAQVLLDDPALAKLDSSERFDELLRKLTEKPARHAAGNAAGTPSDVRPPSNITLSTGTSIGSFSSTKTQAILKLDRKIADGFSEFLLSRMEHLHAEWLATK